MASEPPTEFLTIGDSIIRLERQNAEKCVLRSQHAYGGEIALSPECDRETEGKA